MERSSRNTGVDGTFKSRQFGHLSDSEKSWRGSHSVTECESLRSKRAADPKDLDGLSVNIRSKTEVASWLATFSRSFGADTLHTGSIRDIDQELDVGQAEEDAEAYPEHAIITGLPFSDDDPERAEILASRLVEISRTFDRTLRKR